MYAFKIYKKPFLHIIVDDFLPDDVFSDLCDTLCELPVTRKESDLFQFDQSDDLTRKKSFSELKKQLLHFLDSLRNDSLRNDSHMKESDFSQAIASVSSLDMMAAFYYDDDYLLPHDDQLDERKIAYTFYVAAPKKGGALALLSNKEPYERKKIRVQPNRLVLFLVSNKSWHEIETIKGELPRISLSGWFS